MKHLRMIPAMMLFLLLSMPAVADNAKESLRTAFDNYVKLMQAKDFDKLLDKMHPAIFELAPREMVKEQLKNSFEGEEMTISIDKYTINEVSEVMTEGANQYGVVNYTTNVTMKFAQKMEAEQREFMLKMLQAQVGEENVSWDEATNSIVMVSTKNTYAISPAGINDWKFIDDAGPKQVIDKAVPQSVRKKLSSK